MNAEDTTRNLIKAGFEPVLGLTVHLPGPAYDNLEATRGVWRAFVKHFNAELEGYLIDPSRFGFVVQLTPGRLRVIFDRALNVEELQRFFVDRGATLTLEPLRGNTSALQDLVRDILASNGELFATSNGLLRYRASPPLVVASDRQEA